MSDFKLTRLTEIDLRKVRFKCSERPIDCPICDNDHSNLIFINKNLPVDLFRYDCVAHIRCNICGLRSPFVHKIYNPMMDFNVDTFSSIPEEEKKEIRKYLISEAIIEWNKAKEIGKNIYEFRPKEVICLPYNPIKICYKIKH